MSKFQIIFIAIFVLCIIIGVTLFATYKGKSSDTALPPVTVWGTFPASTFNTLVQQLNNTRSSPLTVSYVEKSQTNFDKDFVEALARGQGPDVILIPQDMILRNSDKIIAVPSTVLTPRDFRNSYIPQAELYLNSLGAVAIPFSIDPLVMYWNRDIFTNSGIATYPKTWDQFSNIINKIDVKDVNSNIRRSAIAMGEFNNVNHAREILGALLLQSGNAITMVGDSGVESVLGDGSNSGSKTSTPAIQFFTQFSDPRSPEYSWNRSLPTSKSWFLSGNLGTYFGFASEVFDIQSKNPNLNFDIAPLPQASNAPNRVTYGSMYGLSIVRNSLNPSAAFTVISALTAPDSLAILSKISYLPPVRRDMLATGSTDVYQSIFYDSALISRGWLDRDPARTSQIFQDMIESITSGSDTMYNAIQTAQGELSLSLQGE